jgi:hypothetical protein
MTQQFSEQDASIRKALSQMSAEDRLREFGNLSAEEFNAVFAATTGQRSASNPLPEKKSWLGSPDEMAALLGHELEQYEPNATTKGKHDSK